MNVWYVSHYFKLYYSYEMVQHNIILIAFLVF